MFTRVDKALAAAIGLWLAGGIAILFRDGLGIEMAPDVETWFATVISGGLVWLIPNRR